MCRWGWGLAVEVDVCTISVSCSDRIAVVTTGIDCCVKAEARNSERQQPRVVCVRVSEEAERFMITHRCCVDRFECFAQSTYDGMKEIIEKYVDPCHCM